MSILEIEVSYQNMLAFLEQLPQAMQDAVQNAAYTVTERIFETAQTLTPVRTGFLLASESMIQEGMWDYMIIARAFYAPFVEFGAR